MSGRNLTKKTQKPAIRQIQLTPEEAEQMKAVSNQIQTLGTMWKGLLFGLNEKYEANIRSDTVINLDGNELTLVYPQGREDVDGSNTSLVAESQE